MTDKQAVVDALGRLPDSASLAEITEELQIMAGIRRGQTDFPAGRSKSREEVEQILEGLAKGEQAIQEGRTSSHQEAKAKLARWLG